MAKKKSTAKRTGRRTASGSRGSQSKRKSTPAHLKGRLDVLRQRMAGWNCDALLLTNAKDIRYLTGFIGDDSWAIVPAKGEVHLLSDSRFEEQIERDAPHLNVTIRTGAMSDALVEALDAAGLRCVAAQAKHMTLEERNALLKKLAIRAIDKAESPGDADEISSLAYEAASRLTQVDDGLIRQRAVKARDEVDLIRKALDIQQRAFRRTTEQLAPGQAETQVAALLEYEMRRLGADGTSFPTIVAADANAALPHAVPGEAKTNRGGFVLFDWGARYGGYCSDLTRVVALGSMPAKIRGIYAVVLEAQQAAIAAIKPGRSVTEVDAEARRVIKDAGYGERFGHGLGHGIGLDIHEQPVLSPRGGGTLEPGHVVTVEPGIYLPGVGGVRIEDDVLVTARGREVLSDLPKDLDSAIMPGS